MPKGGRREGAGRKIGSVTRVNMEARMKAAQEGIMPLDYMLAVMRDEKEPPNRRDDMAKAAAPYLHARLQAHTISGDPNKPVVITTHEQAQEHARNLGLPDRVFMPDVIDVNSRAKH